MTSRALLAVLAAAVVAGGIALWIEVRAPSPPSVPAGSPGETSASGAHDRDSRVPVAAGNASAGDATLGSAAPVAIGEDRARLFATLRDSGSAVEEWTTRGSALLARLAPGASTVVDSGCFVAGCGAVYTFISEAEYERHRGALEATAEYQAWTGGKRWTAPEHERDGHVTIALFLYRPD